MTEYYDQVRPSGRVNKHGACKPCYKDKVRAARLLARYNLTMDEYDTMLIEQGGCAICKTQTNAYGGGNNRMFAVDHDHSTGKVRGLLCQTCNRMIGLARDSSEILRRAVSYLEIQR